MNLSRGYCRALGCGLATLPSTYSRYCSRHRHLSNRHGHPLQTPVRVSELTPFRNQVKAAMERNPDSEAWKILSQRWARIVGHAEEVEAGRQRGQPHNRYEAQASTIVRSVAVHAEPQEVILEVFSVYLLQAWNPHRFKDDKAFRFALANRLRRLTPMSVQVYDHKRRGMKTVYRDVSVRVSEFLGMWSAAAFGAGALQFIDAERKRQEAPREEARRLSAAMENLQ